MAILLIGEVTDGQLGRDSTAKAVTAAQSPRTKLQRH